MPRYRKRPPQVRPLRSGKPRQSSSFRYTLVIGIISLSILLWCLGAVLVYSLITLERDRTPSPAATAPPMAGILAGPGGTPFTVLPTAILSSTPPPAATAPGTTPPPTPPPAPSPAPGATATVPPAAAALAPAAVPIPEQLALVNTDNMLLSINRLVNMGNRYTLALPVENAGIQGARDWLLGEFQAIKQADPQRIDAWTHNFTFSLNGSMFAAENIVLVIYGTDPNMGAVIVGAHYDTISHSDSAYQPGADDNGSGVSAVLEIARIAAMQPHRATIVCVLFAGEEEGRMGSQAFVRDVLGSNTVPVLGMINLDSIGVSVAADGSRLDTFVRAYSAPPDESPSRRLANLVQRVAVQHIPDISVEVYSTLDRQGRWGDQQSFSDAGYPAVRLVELSDNTLRTDTVHDVPETIDLDYLRRNTQIALAAVLVIANGSDVP